MVNLRPLGRIKMFFTDSRYRQFREVFWFAVITLAIHYSYRFWANRLDFWPIEAWMNGLHHEMTRWVFYQSLWVDQHILRLSVRVTDLTMFFDNGWWITINGSCAGDKQLLQFILLLLIYPGNWKHKLWYIPLGTLIIHFTNIFRIAMLSLVSLYKPEWWHFAHDVVLRGMFYVVILILWIIWTERINPSGSGDKI
ncbi:MAG: archaeosortase/exosortase family protein [Bacteroidetes bacterium]|nr:archaeosortase/exosortase family protein [Bacteroidota bacterium]